MGDGCLHEFLEQYGPALSQADLTTVTACWSASALALIDHDALALAALAEIEAFFEQTVAHYHAQGLTAARPTHIAITPINERLAAVDVTWEALAAAGTVRAVEHSRYVLWLGDDGQPHIRETVNQPT